MKAILKRALVTGLISVTWLLGGFSLLSALHLGIPLAILRTLTGIFGLVILFVGILYGMRKARNESETDFTYLKALKTGIIISLVVAVIVSVSSVLYVTLINPNVANDMVKEAETSLKQSGLSTEEIAKKLNAVRSEFSPGMQAIIPLIAQSVMGSIFSVILAFFFRSKKN